MKLTLKLVFAVIALIVLILGTDAYFSVQRESEFLDKELERKAYRIGNALKELVSNEWQARGPDAALAVIQEADRRETIVKIRWVWLDATANDRDQPQASPEMVNQVTGREIMSVRYRNAEGKSVLLTYFTMNLGKRTGAIELSEPLSGIDDFVRDSIHRKIILMITVVLATFGLMLLLGIWQVGWPLERLTEKARRAGSGDLSEPLTLKSRDELSELAETLNQMCDQLAASRQQAHDEAEGRIATIEQLRHADRLRTVGQLASGVAHELGTPLNVVSGRASLIMSGRLEPSAVVESAEIIKSQAERMTGIIRKLLDFSRSGTSRKIDLDLMLIIRETVKILEPLSMKHGVDILVREPESDIAGQTTANVDPSQIQQVLTNLIVNAIQATPSGGRVTISLTKRRTHAPTEHSKSDESYFCVTIEDTGHGIADDVRNRIFEPFVTTKDIGEGTGLGLSIAYGIIQEHGGWIDVDSKVGFGSRFDVYLPERGASCPIES